MGETPYLVQSASLKCSCGTSTSKLQLPMSHGVYYSGKAVMQCTDCIPIMNILPFGTCAITKVPCVPAPICPWMKPYTKTVINGIPTLTTDSMLICALGGIIKPQTSGQ